MREKYNLGLAAFISVIASASFVCGYLTMYWLSEYDKDESKKKYQEIMHFITKQEIYPDLFNIRMKLSMLKSIDSGEKTDWSTTRKLFLMNSLSKEKSWHSKSAHFLNKIGMLMQKIWQEK